MLFSYDVVYVYASEIENTGGAVAEATKDDVNFDMEELTCTPQGNFNTIHSVC